MPILTIHPIHQLKVLNVVDLKSYYEKNKETIDKYNQFKRDIDKQRHIENPKFSLQLMNKERHPYMYKIEYNGTSRKIIPRILDGVLTTNFRSNILRVYVDA